MAAPQPKCAAPRSSYAAKLGGHKRHRDALMFVGAQDLSVLAALLLLAATGPGGISVDAKYGKGN